MNNLNLPNDQMNALLKMAGAKLGRDPQELQQALEAGQLEQVLGNMDPKAQKQMNALLQNPKAVEAMLQNDKIKNLIGGLMGGQK